MNAPVPSEQFSIGEIAIVIAANFHPENIGQEVEIVGPLQMRYSRQTGAHIHTYRMRRGDGKEFAVHPHHLRKKRPPREDLQVMRWDQCPWQPENINV
jgi:hypothetical protein